MHGNSLKLASNGVLKDAYIIFYSNTNPEAEKGIQSRHY